MPLILLTHQYKDAGDIVGNPSDEIIYKVRSIEPTTPGGFIRAPWKMQLVRASEEEALVFRIMES